MFQHATAVWRCRHFWLSLVRMDVGNRYRRSVLGIGWSLLNPLAMTAVFCIVFSSIMGQSNWQTYAPFVLAGLAVWEFIRNAAVGGCQTFIRNEAYIRQCPLPYAIYPIRTVLGAAVHYLISLGVMVVLIAALEQSLDVFAVIPAVVPAILLAGVFCWALATLSGFATVYFHDLSHMVEVGAQLFFFMTPIIYTREVLDKKGIGWLADLNPVNLFLELIRTPLVGDPLTHEHHLPELGLYMQAVVMTAAAVGLACGTMAWLQKKLIFQL